MDGAALFCKTVRGALLRGRWRSLLLLQLLLLQLELLLLFLLLDLGAVMAHGTPNGCAGHAMVSRHVAGNATDCRAFQATLGVGDGCGQDQGEGSGNCQQYRFHESTFRKLAVRKLALVHCTRCERFSGRGVGLQPLQSGDLDRIVEVVLAFVGLAADKGQSRLPEGRFVAIQSQRFRWPACQGVLPFAALSRCAEEKPSS